MQKVTKRFPLEVLCVNRPPIGVDALNRAWQLSEAASTTENYRMAMPTTPEIEALISEATAPVPDGSSRLDVVDDPKRLLELHRSPFLRKRRLSRAVWTLR